MSEEQITKKGKTVSVSVERKLNLGNYENVSVSTHLSSGTMEEEDADLEAKAEELAEVATRSVHKELHKIKSGDFDKLAGEDDESKREDAFDDLKQQAEELSEERENR